MPKTFKRTVTISVEIEIDQTRCREINDEWRSRFYDLRTIDDIASHLAFNLVQGRSLQSLDGFALWGESDVRIEIGEPEVEG